MNVTCARWTCDRSASYEKPLCYKHWLEFTELEIAECDRCHWLFDWAGFNLANVTDEDLQVCDACWISIIVCGRLITFYRPFVCREGDVIGFLADCIIR